MSKAKKITYWIFTLWLSLGMTVSGMMQLIGHEESVKMTTGLGYPAYFLILIGIWKILGVITILIPGFPILKEWAYAGFFFTASGALFSHLAAGHPLTEAIGPMLLIVITILSWYFRPPGRKTVSLPPNQ